MCDSLTWHKLSMVHAKANTTNNEAPVNKLTSFKKRKSCTGSPINRIRLNRRVLTWLYMRT